MKGDLIHVNPDKIDYVRIVGPQQEKFKWYDEMTVTSLFGLIKFGTVEPGWSTHKDEYQYDYTRFSTEHLEKSGYLFVKENMRGLQWYKKPYIYVVMGRNYIKEFYPSVEEAEEMVNKLLANSKSKFSVLRELT